MIMLRDYGLAAVVCELTAAEFVCELDTRLPQLANRRAQLGDVVSIPQR
jgi:hypothetical protein